MKEARHIFVEGFLFIVLSNSDQPATVPFVLSTDTEQPQWHRSPLCVAGCGIPQLASPTYYLPTIDSLAFPINPRMLSMTAATKSYYQIHTEIYGEHMFFRQAG